MKNREELLEKENEALLNALGDLLEHLSDSTQALAKYLKNSNADSAKEYDVTLRALFVSMREAKAIYGTTIESTSTEPNYYSMENSSKCMKLKQEANRILKFDKEKTYEFIHSSMYGSYPTRCKIVKLYAGKDACVKKYGHQWIDEEVEREIGFERLTEVENE